MINTPYSSYSSSSPFRRGGGVAATAGLSTATPCSTWQPNKAITYRRCRSLPGIVGGAGCEPGILPGRFGHGGSSSRPGIVCRAGRKPGTQINTASKLFRFGPGSSSSRCRSSSTDNSGWEATPLKLIHEDDCSSVSSEEERPLHLVLPPTVNWHLEERCNYGCKFCFGTFNDIPREDVLQRQAQLLQVPRLLRQWGAGKITFSGGEPFLHPAIDDLIMESKRAGLVTGVVTNGSLLTPQRLLALRPYLDWIAFSVDASTDDLHVALGRGKTQGMPPGMSQGMTEDPSKTTPPLSTSGGATGDPSQTTTPLSASSTAPSAQQQQVHGGHLAQVKLMWRAAEQLGYSLKLNTVVARANLEDDMTELVAELRPLRWKVFQALPVEGQNSGSIEPLLITPEEFQTWLDRHQAVQEVHGIPLIAESNELMRGSYSMLDATCRFFTNAQGGHTYSKSILEVGMPAAWEEIAQYFSVDKFVDRGGLYEWGQGGEDLERQRASLHDHEDPNNAPGP